MKKELIITPEVQAILDSIENTGKIWYETYLPDHPIYPQFKRSLCVTGFNTPDMEGSEDRIYVMIRQHLVLKKDNTIYKRLEMPLWLIHEGNMEELMGENGPIKVDFIIRDENNQVVERGQEVIKAKSVQYIRYLIKTKSMHLVDILARFMPLYIEINTDKINSI